MEYFLYHIEEAKSKFGQDNSLGLPKQISLWAKQFLQQIIEEKGFTFNKEIGYTLEGKPFFKYNPKQEFSISHTKQYIAIALHNKPIGIDIEQVRQYKASIAQRFLHPKEAIYLASLSNANLQNRAFTQLWTLKEAYVKCTGEGIANNLKTFQIILPKRANQNPQILYNKTQVKLQSEFNNDEGIFISICYQE
jgi:4'-phosphopantetheinyl transferase